MDDPVAATIDVEQLRRNFSAAEGREWTADDVMDWLRGCGFRYQGRTWLCEDVSLRVLARSEYRIVGEHQQPKRRSPLLMLAATSVTWLCCSSATFGMPAGNAEYPPEASPYTPAAEALGVYFADPPSPPAPKAVSWQINQQK